MSFRTPNDKQSPLYLQSPLPSVCRMKAWLSLTTPHLQDPLSWRQWVKDWVSILCPVSLLLPDSMVGHSRHGPCKLPSTCASSPVSPTPRRESFPKSLPFLSEPQWSSNFILQLFFPFPLLPVHLPFGVFNVDAPWHFKPSCLIGTFTWPKTTSVNGSIFLPVIEAWNISFTFHIIAFHPHCSSSPRPALSFSSPMVWKSECLSSLRHQSAGLMAFLYCSVGCFCIHSSCQC